jgi:hypothetical protein
MNEPAVSIGFSVARAAGRALAFASLISAVGCASGPRGAGAEAAASGVSKYPARPPGCKLAVFRTTAPDVVAWDDLGVAEVACHLDVAAPQCLQRLRAEACRMGGDIIYNIPRRPLRPADQVLVYRGQVAHSRPGSAKKKTEAPLPPPANPSDPPDSPDEAVSPITPVPADGVAPVGD